MSESEVLAYIRGRLGALADAKHAAGAKRYFLDTIEPMGVRSADVHGISREVYGQVKAWPVAGRNRLCLELWKSGVFEEGTVAIYLYRRFARQCGVCEFKLFERWIDRYVTNWAHCDGVAAWLIGGALKNDVSLIGELSGWTASKNRWKRRAAAVSFVGVKLVDPAPVFEVAERLRTDEDDMVRKGIGWMLKVIYGQHPKETVEFLRSGSPPFARLVLRYAAEKMTVGDRKRVLG